MGHQRVETGLEFAEFALAGEQAEGFFARLIEAAVGFAQFGGAQDNALLEVLVELAQFGVAGSYARGHFVERTGQSAQFIVTPDRRAGGNVAHAHLLRGAREFGQRLGNLPPKGCREKSEHQRERDQARPQNPLRGLKRLPLQLLPRHGGEEEPLGPGQSGDAVIRGARAVVAGELPLRSGAHGAEKAGQRRFAAVLHSEFSFAGEDFLPFGGMRDEPAIAPENDVPRARQFAPRGFFHQAVYEKVVPDRAKEAAIPYERKIDRNNG